MLRAAHDRDFAFHPPLDAGRERGPRFSRDPAPAGQGGDHIPRMFAALLLITVTGLAVFGLMVGLQQMLPGHWHDSAVKTES